MILTRRPAGWARFLGAALFIVTRCGPSTAQSVPPHSQGGTAPVQAQTTMLDPALHSSTTKRKSRLIKRGSDRPSPPATSGQTEPQPAVNDRGTAGPISAGAPASAPSGASLTGELEPVLHARSAGITACMDNIVTQAGSVIDRPHTAISTWVSQNANAHAFQSLIGLSYPNKTAPNGAAVIVAAPVASNQCEGASIQVYPTSQSCSVIQAALIKTGRTIATLQGLPVVETQDNARNMLMPTSGAGCVVVTVRIR